MERMTVFGALLRTIVRMQQSESLGVTQSQGKNDHANLACPQTFFFCLNLLYCYFYLILAMLHTVSSCLRNGLCAYECRSQVHARHFFCTFGRITRKSPHGVLGHSLRHWLIPSLRSRAHSLACSLTHSGVHGKEVFIYELSASISYSFIPLYSGLKCTLC